MTKLYLDKFKEVRKKAKINQEKLANILNRGRKTIQRWETGESTPPDSEIRIMAKLFHVPVQQISDLKDLNYSKYERKDDEDLTTCPATGSFLDTLDTELEIHDQIMLEGINLELQSLRAKVRRMEERLNSSGSVTDNLDLFIYRKDIKGRFTYVNKAYLNYLQVTSNQILDRNNTEIFGISNTKEIENLEQLALNGTRVYNVQITIPGSRSKKLGLLSISQIYESNGEIKEIVAAINDVSGIMGSVQRYKTIEKAVNTSNEILWIKTLNGNYSFISASIKTISGYRSKDFEENPRRWLTEVVDKYDRDRVGGFYRSFQNGESVQYKINTAKGDEKYLRERIFRQEQLTFGIIQDVSNELKTHEDKQLLLSVLDEMPEAIGVVKNFGKEQVYVSPAIHDITGISLKYPSASFNDQLAQLVHPGDIKRVTEYRNYIDSDEWWQKETKHSMQESIKYRISKNGKTKWLKATNNSTPKLKKHGIRFGIIKDITSEQEQLLEMEYLSECVNDMDSMFWAAEIVTKRKKQRLEYITISNGVKKLYGKTKTQFLADRNIWQNLLHPDNKELAKIDLCTIEFPYDIEYKVLIDGKTKCIQERIYRKENLLFGMARDITEQKRKEAIQNLITESINEIKVSLGVYDVNKQTYIYSNKACRDVFGIDKQITNNNLLDYWLKNIVHPEDRKEQEKYVKAMVIKGKRPTTRNYRIIHPQKGVRTIKVFATNVIDFLDDRYIASLSIDVTDQTKASEK